MKISMIISAALLVGATAFAADVEKKDTKDTSTNPMTGTETTTTTHMAKDGDKKVSSKKKVKHHKDGKVEATTETKTETPATH